MRINRRLISTFILLLLLGGVALFVVRRETWRGQSADGIDVVTFIPEERIAFLRDRVSALVREDGPPLATKEYDSPVRRLNPDITERKVREWIMDMEQVFAVDITEADLRRVTGNPHRREWFGWVTPDMLMDLFQESKRDGWDLEKPE